MSKAKNKEVLAANGTVVVSKDTKKENKMANKGLTVEVIVDDVQGEVDVPNVVVDGQQTIAEVVEGGPKVMTKADYIAGMKMITAHIEGKTVAEALPYLVRIVHGAIQMVIAAKAADKKFALEREVITVINANGLFPASVNDQLKAICPGKWKSAGQVFFDVHAASVMFQKDRNDNQVAFYGSAVGKNKKGYNYKDATRFWRLSVAKADRKPKTAPAAKEVMNG